MDCGADFMLFADDDMEDYEQLQDAPVSKNVVRISYSVITENKQSHQTSPFYCRGCRSAFCFYSNILPRDDYYKKMTEEVASVKENKSDEEIGLLEGKYIQDLSADEAAWICEFCEVHNRLPKNAEKPQAEDELYLIKKTGKFFWRRKSSKSD